MEPKHARTNLKDRYLTLKNLKKMVVKLYRLVNVGRYAPASSMQPELLKDYGNSSRKRCCEDTSLQSEYEENSKSK